MNRSYSVFFFITFLFLNWNSYAQTIASDKCPINPGSNSPGKFNIKLENNSIGIVEELTSTKELQICVGSTLLLEDLTVGGQTIKYIIGYSGKDDGSEVNNHGSASTSYGFNEVGKFTIIQVGSGASTGGSYACQVVEVVDLPRPDFEILPCVSGSIVVNLLDTPNNSSFKSVDIFVDTDPSSVFSATYTSLPYRTTPISFGGGSFINVLGRTTSGACKNSKGSQPLITFNPPQKIFKKLNFTTTSLAVADITTGFEKQLSLYEAINGIRVPISPKIQSGQFSTVGLNYLSNICFEAEIKDGCGVLVKEDKICSIPNFLVETQANKTQKISWESPSASNVKAYIVERIDRSISTIPKTVALIEDGETQYEDVAVDCGKFYEYRITAVLAEGEQVITPLINSEKTYSTTPLAKIEGDILAERTSDTSIRIDFPEAVLSPQNSFYIIRQDITTDKLKFAGKTNETFFVDKNISPNSQYCYFIDRKSTCNTDSDDSAVCPIILETKPSSMSGVRLVHLNWNEYIGFAQIQSQVIEIIDPETKSIIQTIEVPVNASEKDLSIDESFRNPKSGLLYTRILIRVGAISSSGKVVYSNSIIYRNSQDIPVPNTFSPNGDGRNDVFLVPILYNFSSFELQIFTRWGELVYSSTDPENQGWNGKISGNPAPEGTYIYRLHLGLFNDIPYEKSGSFILVR